MRPKAPLQQFEFYKLEALANDFVLIDARDREPTIEASRIQQLADRRTGIGFDQLLLLKPSMENAVAAIEIFNADGSIAEQCGNGMRAIAAWLARTGQLASSTRIQTPAGDVMLARAGDGGFSADLPGPAPLSHTALGLPVPTLPANVDRWDLVSLGNPHLIVRWPAEITAATLAGLVSSVEQNSAWRQQVNIGVVRIESEDQIALRVHERGAGATQACGSAACAAAWTLRRQHANAAPVSVRQPGGTLVVDLNAASGRVVTTGPARVVFEGRLWND